MKTILILSLVTILVSCKKDDSGLKPTPSDSKIIIEAREVLEPNSRQLTLYCKTEKIYPCVNFSLLTEEEIKGNSFKITFTSVEETDICLTATGPATKLLDFDSLSNGEYNIELNNGNKKNKGKLKITHTDITLRFAKKNDIEIVREETKRVPDHTYWVTIGYHTEPSSTLVEEFIQKFKDAGAVFNKQLPGHYFHYEINNSGDIIYNAKNSGYYFMKKAIFQYDGDESKLKEIIEVEGKDHKDALSIRLESYKGESFFNWGK